MLKKLFATYVISLACLTYPLAARAQAVSNAQINGRVTDSSGAVVPAAEIRATNLATQANREVQSNADGEFVLNELSIGRYSLLVRAHGFKDYQRSGIDLHVGDNIEMNVSLSVGEASETVNVNAAASVVDTTENGIRQVMESENITNLPLNGRQPTQLVLLSGGAVNVATSTLQNLADILTSKNFYSSVTISVAGGIGNSLNYVLDGGDNNDPMTNVNLPFPFPEALQEFNVDTSTLPAQYGLHPAGVVDIATRSGGDQFHGDAFEYIRNYDVNATNYFSHVNDGLQRNQFGGVIGGRVVRNKLFFFGGYQGTRNVQHPTSISYVPTAAALAGNFSTLESSSCVASGARTLINPNTGLPYSPTNQIPTTSFSPAAVELATKYLPQTSNPCGEVVYSIPTTGNEDQVIGRIDENINAKQSLFGRYFADDYRNPGVFTNSNLLQTTRAGNLELSQSATIGHTYIFDPNTMNSLHLSVTRLRNSRGPAANAIDPGQLGINLYDYVPSTLEVTVGSDFVVGCGSCSPAHINRDELQIADDVNLVRGPHSMIFGVDLIHAQLNSLTPSNGDGDFTFNGTYTGDAMADFLVGDMSSFSQAAPIATNYRGSFYGFYAQDTYKIRKLTVNAGLRWEPYLPADNIHGWGTVFSPDAYLRSQTSTTYVNAPIGVFYYGDKGIPKSLAHSYLPNLSPRLGLVFVPGAQAHDTFRVGGAILTDVPELYFGNHSISSSSPYADSVSLSGPVSFDNPWSGYAGGSPYPLPALSSTVSFPKYGLYVAYPTSALKPMTVAQWNASYEHQFNQGYLLTVTYLGNKTSHIFGSDNQNPAQYIPGTCGTSACSTTANTNQRRILNTTNANAQNKFGDLELISSNGNASYNSLRVAVNRRLAQGYTILANYTYSHCISDLESLGDPYEPEYEVPFDMEADRASCDYDVRNLINASIVAQSPKIKEGILGYIASNWQLAPLVTYQGGMPSNVLSGSDRSLTGQNLDRPNRVQGVGIYPAARGPQQWLSAAAFSQNALGTFGNLGRNAIRNPGFFELDAAVSRIFPIHENLTSELRLDVFNVTNWVNFGAPNSTLSSSNFGRITTANNGTVSDTPRILQLALKLHF